MKLRRPAPNDQGKEDFIQCREGDSIFVRNLQDKENRCLEALISKQF